jgi:hypothetical protein
MDNIPSEYICPITHEIMEEPVCDNEGNTFEKQAIMKWLARNRNSPISRLPLRIADLRPNIALKNLIASFIEKNKEAFEHQKMREARLRRFDGSSQPSPTPAAAQPSPTPAAVQPSPTSAAAQPSPTSAAAQPSPTPAAVQPSPTSAAAQPSPTPINTATSIPSAVQLFIQTSRNQDPSFNPTSEHIRIMNLRMSVGLIPTRRSFNSGEDWRTCFDSCPLEQLGPRGGRNPFRIPPSECDCWKCEDKRDYDRIINHHQLTSQPLPTHLGTFWERARLAEELHSCVAVVPPGQFMEVLVNGQLFKVVVPGGVQPGENFQFRLPPAAARHRH